MLRVLKDQLTTLDIPTFIACVKSTYSGIKHTALYVINDERNTPMYASIKC